MKNDDEELRNGKTHREWAVGEKPIDRKEYETTDLELRVSEREFRYRVADYVSN